MKHKHKVNLTLAIVYVIIITSITLIYAQNDIGYMFINEKTIPLDKQTHFVAGGFIALTSYHTAYSINGGNRKNSKFWGIVTPIVIGTIKELSDTKKGGTGFDVIDLGYTAVGGVIGTYTIDFLIGVDKRRSKRAIKKIYNPIDK